MALEVVMAAQPSLAEAYREEEPVMVRDGVTVADYLAMPESMTPYNLIEGRLYMSPTPVMRHQRLVGHLMGEMQLVVERQGGEAVVSPMDCHLPDGSVLQPDVLWFSHERLHIIERWVMGAPDLVIEVLSPGTRRFDRTRKLASYAKNGVREVWLVDADSSTLIVFSGDGTKWTQERSVLFGDDIPSNIVQIGSGGLEDFA